jgi:hypothetical protein
LSRLNGIAVLFEYQVADGKSEGQLFEYQVADGKSEGQLFEWK